MAKPLEEWRIDLVKAVTENVERTKSLDEKIDSLSQRFDNNDFVTLDRFKPVERLAYGATATILMAVLTAIVGLVVWNAQR